MNRAVFQYRPRVLTVVLIAVIATLIVLANLSRSVSAVDTGAWRGMLYRLSYGWPLVWGQHLFVGSAGPTGFVGWYWSGPRLLVNIALWLILLGTPGAGGEWLLRRHPLRFRWSLRAMLLFVSIAATACAWLAAARNRALLQDDIIAEVEARDGTVWVERSGPDWLELLGADRFRRHIIGAELGEKWKNLTAEENIDEETTGLLTRMRRLSRLRYVSFKIEHLTPAVAEALNDMPQLRMLSVERGYATRDAHDSQVADECLTAIGRMRHLEDLMLTRLSISDQGFRSLAGLTSLKSLRLDVVAPPGDDFTIDTGPVLLASFPRLPKLETLDLALAWIGNRDLPYLSKLPKLRTLSLWGTQVDGAGLAKLGASHCLEELNIGGDMVTVEGLRSLAGLKRLKTLHLGDCNEYRHPDVATLRLDDESEIKVPRAEIHEFHKTIHALRHAKPGIVIDDNSMPHISGNMSLRLGWWYDTTPHHDDSVWSPLNALAWLPSPLRDRVEADAIRDGIATSF